MKAMRMDELARRMSALIETFLPSAALGCDIGPETGDLARELSRMRGIRFQGVEPDLKQDVEVLEGIRVLKGWAHQIPFEDGSFDVITFTGVYEHIDPQWRAQSLAEMKRVLRPGGILVGEMPNMYFPIETHSALPIQQFLPRRLGDAYVKAFDNVMMRKGGMFWFRVGVAQLIRDANRAGLTCVYLKGSNFSSKTLPPFFRVGTPILRLIPLSYDFCFVRTRPRGGATKWT
jgi:SAM-dependent methyltransferase